MGVEIDRDTFDDEDFTRFARRLAACTEALGAVLAREGFGRGDASLGVELECSLVDDAGRPAPVNRAVLADACDARVTLEIDRFNMEINGSPTPLRGAPFSTMAQDLSSALGSIRRAA